jgi:hypothetical protein
MKDRSLCERGFEAPYPRGSKDDRDRQQMSSVAVAVAVLTILCASATTR